MTVLVRPVPKRAGSNGIRPFVRPPLNNIRPYTIKNWRPPVPEPLPPAPLLGPKELLGLGVLVLAQIWGWLATRPKAVPSSANLPFEGKIATSGTTTVTVYKGMYPTPSGSTSCSAMKSIDGTAVLHISKTVGPGATFELKPSTAKSSTCSGNPQRQEIWVGGALWSSIDAGTWGTPFWEPKIVAGSATGTEWTPTPSVPDGWPVPDVEPEPASPPKIPVIPTVVPTLPPAPETEPGRVPVEPGPSRPPSTTPRPPVFRPIRPVSPTGTKDGAIVPKPADPVTVTDPDWHFPIPGKGPIVGNGPRPTPEEMAKELGRLEQKLNSILNPTPDTPMEWQNWLEQIREALFNLVDGTTYTLTEYCNPDNDPDYMPASWVFEAKGALNAFGVIGNRLDALAAMIDQSLRAAQQICPPVRPRPVGELVTVNFIAPTKPPGSSAYLRKQFRYRDNAGRSEADHVAHWLPFEWQAGPAIVTSRGAVWGVVQVWAADPAEGRRVINHAAAIAGVDLKVQGHRWEDSTPRSARYGQAGVMRVEHDQQGTPCISKRVGPAGRPDWALDP